MLELFTNERMHATKVVPAKGLRLDAAVESAPTLWSFRNAERGQLTVGQTGLSFGSWSIPRQEVTAGHWCTPREMPFALVAILRVRTRDQLFEFAVEPRLLSWNDLPFAVTRVEISVLSRRVKVLLGCSLVAWVIWLAMRG